MLNQPWKQFTALVVYSAIFSGIVANQDIPLIASITPWIGYVIGFTMYLVSWYLKHNP